MFNYDSKDEAINKFNDFKIKWNNKYYEVFYNTGKKSGELLIFYNYPASIRRSLKSTKQ